MDRKSKQRNTYPKEGEKKSKDTIQKLKGRNRYLEKKIKWYEKELIHISSGERKIKKTAPSSVTAAHKREEFRKDFLARFKDSLKERI